MPNEVRRLAKLLHIKITEKFKDYRSTYKAFNPDMRNGMRFTDFCQGFEDIGIFLEHETMRMLFDTLDRNLDGEISYFEFCSLNPDHCLRIKPVPMPFVARKRLFIKAKPPLPNH